jgi:hypothetical protein
MAIKNLNALLAFAKVVEGNGDEASTRHSLDILVEVYG